MNEEVMLAKEMQSAFQGAAKLIDADDKWCRKIFARNRNGQECNLFSSQTTRFCGEGAIHRACWEQGRRTEVGALAIDFVEHQLKTWGSGEFSTLADLNDSPNTSREDIVRLFNWCIDRLEEKCQS